MDESEPKIKRYREESMISASFRGLDFYLNTFGLRKEVLRNKRILDLGAGKEAQFAREVHDANIGAKVISFSPHFSQEAVRSHSNDVPDRVAGIAQELPFKGEQFDYVFAAISVPTYIISHVRAQFGDLDAVELAKYSAESSREVTRMTKEVFSVLKPGGKAYFYPFTKKYKTYVLNNITDGSIKDKDITVKPNFVGVLTRPKG